MFKKTLTAGLLAATVATTSLAPTTASADLSNKDAAIGIVTLLLLGAAINDNRNDNHVATPTHAPRASRALPRSCLRMANTRRGDQLHVFSRNCLSTNWGNVSALPQRCHISFRNPDGNPRYGYLYRCLQNSGFRTSRH